MSKRPPDWSYGRMWVDLKSPVEWAKRKDQSWFKPGVTILTDTDDVYVVGDINEEGGVCDDCTVVGWYTTIVAYIEAPMIPEPTTQT